MQLSPMIIPFVLVLALGGGASCLVFHKLPPVVMVLIHFMNQSGGDVSKK